MSLIPSGNEVTAFDLERERVRAAAVEFGIHLRRWRQRQGWAQDTPMEWGKVTGLPHVYSSQWSQLEQGVMRNPGPLIFVALGAMTRCLHRHEYGPIRPRALADRVHAAAPVCHDDGEPWDAADWFAAYIGQLSWPSSQEPEPPQITDEQAASWSATLREWFQSTAAAANLAPLDAAVGALSHAGEDQEDRQRFQRLLLGWSGYRASDLLDLWERDQAPVEWLAAWRRSLGLRGDSPAPPWS